LFASEIYAGIRQKYDGGRWDYTGFMQESSFPNIGIGMEKSITTMKAANWLIIYITSRCLNIGK